MHNCKMAQKIIRKFTTTAHVCTPIASYKNYIAIGNVINSSVSFVNSKEIVDLTQALSVK